MRNNHGKELNSDAPPVLVRIQTGYAREGEKRFTRSFLIGRSGDCDFQLKDDRVSRRHAQVFFDGRTWRVQDLNSANGTYLNGIRVKEEPLPEKAEIELGRGGPLLSIRVEQEKPIVEEVEVNAKKKEFSSETQIIQRYFDKSKTEKAGEHTMMFRRAFERVHKKKSRKYRLGIIVVLCMLVAAAGVIVYQKNKIQKLRNTAVDMFYAMKSLELQIAQLEEIILLKADREQVQNLLQKRQQLKEMEKDYDTFVKELGIYKKLGREEQIIFRLARLFGECEVNIPKGFIEKVKSYIEKWKSTQRLRNGMERAKSNNYAPKIADVLAEHNLPPHFFYLALQESGFRTKAIGPKTRYGFAKGMWQFIPTTAEHYGLRVGPMYDKNVYDPKDERFHFEKATKAAAQYLRDINNTEAQASGLLVMASYNWGETRVRRIIRKMPENPRERNFWRLLANANIPRETYDYVFYIFSASVICEDPQLFGIDFECPDFSPLKEEEETP